MNKSAVYLGAAVLAMFCAGCTAAAPDTREADTKALKDLETQWNQDFAAKNIDRLVAHYTDDAVLMGPGMPASSGKDSIRKTLTEMVADPALSLKFGSARVEVAKSGDLAYTQGSYTMTMTDPNSKQEIHDHGSYVTAYKKQPNGSWKATSDIATSEVPPPAPPMPAAAKKK